MSMRHAFGRAVIDERPIILDLSAIGPDQAASWTDLSNIGRLCPDCQAVDWEPIKTYLVVADGYTFFPRIALHSTYPTLGQVRAAAHQGCHLCTLILTCLITARYESSTEQISILRGPAQFSVDFETVIKVDVEVTSGQTPVWLTVEIDHCPDALLGWLSYRLPIKAELARNLHSIHFSSSAEDVARFWLENCLGRHEQCKSETPMLPRRVVDVSPGHEPFLFITKCQRSRYAALSYCFGKGPVLTTTEKTLQERQAGIPITILPKTVRDAVTWTRDLGLQYLWVDSLCILQDKLADWEAELSVMADIYQDATVTIAATASAHAGGGCAPVRNKLQFAPFAPLPGVVIEANVPRQAWIFQKGPLEKRGWTFQEIQLSQRVLRCGGEQLAWQCRTGKYLEGNPGNRHWLGRRSGAYGPRTSFGTRALDDTQLMDTSVAFQVWYQMVEQFTTRDLTFPEDKLPAFSGIARHFARLLGAVPPRGRSPLRYICGLWQDDLLQGLIWRCSQPGMPIQYRGPTWSWVACESRIFYNGQRLRQDDFHAQVLDVSVTAPGLNPYGRVSSGKITMLGPVASMPSSIYGDEFEIPSKTCLSYFVDWDLLGPPRLGSICFRLHKQFCLILAPEEMCYRGTYRRVGIIMASADSDSFVRMTLNKLDWQNEVVKII